MDQAEAQTCFDVAVQVARDAGKVRTLNHARVVCTDLVRAQATQSEHGTVALARANVNSRVSICATCLMSWSANRLLETATSVTRGCWTPKFLLQILLQRPIERWKK